MWQSQSVARPPNLLHYQQREVVDQHGEANYLQMILDSQGWSLFSWLVLDSYRVSRDKTLWSLDLYLYGKYSDASVDSSLRTFLEYKTTTTLHARMASLIAS